MSNTIDSPNFDEMDIGKLRQYASHLRVPVEKTAKKEDIIAAISAKLKNRSTVPLAEDRSSVPPGHAKIVILEDTMPGASNIPVFLNANGYVCTIPRGKEVIVPMRVVRTLNDAKTQKRKQTLIHDPATGRERFAETTVVAPSYPFNVLEMTPGPEPLTTLEASKKKTIGPRRRYQALFGHWPKGNELPRAIEAGLISLKDDEDLSSVDKPKAVDE